MSIDDEKFNEVKREIEYRKRATDATRDAILRLERFSVDKNPFKSRDVPIERNPFKVQAEYEWIFREIWEDRLKEILKSDNHRVSSDFITEASESALKEEKRDPSGTYQHIFGKKEFSAEQIAPVGSGEEAQARVKILSREQQNAAWRSFLNEQQAVLDEGQKRLHTRNRQSSDGEEVHAVTPPRAARKSRSTRSPNFGIGGTSIAGSLLRAWDSGLTWLANNPKRASGYGLIAGAIAGSLVGGPPGAAMGALAGAAMGRLMSYGAAYVNRPSKEYDQHGAAAGIQGEGLGGPWPPEARSEAKPVTESADLRPVVSPSLQFSKHRPVSENVATAAAMKILEFNQQGTHGDYGADRTGNSVKPHSIPSMNPWSYIARASRGRR